MSICNHEFLIFNHANINNCLSLGLTKTDNEMSFNRAGHSTQSLSTRNLKLLGCEILGTAARSLAPLTNFPGASAVAATSSSFSKVSFDVQ